jgi:hypothetical protein
LTRRIFAPPSQLIFTVEAKVSLSKPSSHSISQEKSLPGLSDLREPKDSSSASWVSFSPSFIKVKVWISDVCVYFFRSSRRRTENGSRSCSWKKVSLLGKGA